MRSTLIYPTGMSFLILALSLSSGCHRSFYRHQADDEALAIISEKASDPRWSLPNYQIRPAEHSRMYSPFSQDHPPMPPDDPSSGQLMERVDGKPGYPHWHANGDTPFVENPEWRLYLQFDDEGHIKLDMDDAFRLALVHNREYQRQNEQLYLSALDVSLERFDFETQLFAGYQSFFSVDGWRRGPSSLLDASTRNTFARKAGITGSTLIVGFANTLLWQFSGPNVHSVNTLVDFSLIQPLLRGAGRDRVLESLTQAERTLLAVIRDIERFRREFYLGITTGLNASGLGSGGYLDLLQTQQQIRIRESNVATQRSVVAQFKALVEAGRLPNQQLQFTQSSLYSAQEALLRQKNAYEFSLDQFKIDLGLPPDLPVLIEDDMLDQFQLVDAEMTDRQNRLTNLQDSTGSTILLLLDLRRERAEELGIPIGAVDYNASGFRVEVPPMASVQWSQDLIDGLEMMLAHIDQAAGIHREIVEISLPQAKADISGLESKIGQRVKSLRLLRENLENSSSGEGDYAIEPEVLSDDQLEDLPLELRNFVALVERRLDQFQVTLDKARSEVQFLIDHGESLTPVARANYLQGDVTNKVPTYLRELAGLYLELTLIQVEARTDSISLNPVDVAAEKAYQVARLYRRDWMNARADLVDAWRQIEFVADELESEFDLVLEGDVTNVSKNPLDLQANNGSLRAGFEFDAPITRLAERNNYRTALINYSQARRNYYAFEDQINLQLRQTIRTLEQIKYNFEIARRGVKLAVMRVDQTDSELSRPPEPNASSRSLGSTAARDLLDALDDLRDTQLNFLNLWVQYEVLRRQLDLDMGTMELNSEGMWVDPGEFTSARIDELIDEAYQWPQPDSIDDFEFPGLSVQEEELLGEPLEGKPLPLNPLNNPINPPENPDRRPAPGLPMPPGGQALPLDSIQVPDLDPSSSLQLRRPANSPGSTLELGMAPQQGMENVSGSRQVSHQAPLPDVPPRETPGTDRSIDSRSRLSEGDGDSQPRLLDTPERAYFRVPLLEPWQAIKSDRTRSAEPHAEFSSRRSKRAGSQ